MAQITEHFSEEEMTVTQQTDMFGKVLPNVCDPTARLFLKQGCETILEHIREIWGCPVHVSSGFRSPAVERKVQKRPFPLPLKTSQHMLGQAADIVPVSTRITLDQAYAAIVSSSLPYDQLLLEGGVDKYGDHRWIHVSWAPPTRPPRRMALVSADGVNFSPYKVA